MQMSDESILARGSIGVGEGLGGLESSSTRSSVFTGRDLQYKLDLLMPQTPIAHEYRAKTGCCPRTDYGGFH